MGPIDSYVAVKGATSVVEGKSSNWVLYAVVALLIVGVGVGVFFGIRAWKRRKQGGSV